VKKTKIKYKVLNLALVALVLCLCTVEGSAQTYLLNSTTNNTTINTCGGTFYDSGQIGDYSSNENYAVTFCDDNGGNLTMDFTSFDVENEASCSFDVLRIYDGSSTGSTQLGSYCGTNSPGTITSTGTCLHVTFYSDISETRPGWSATISCSTATELCGNGVDDDGDGLVDCADDDCNLGIATSVVSSSGVSNANNSLGAADSQFAQLYDSNDEITLKLSQQINAGDNYTIRWRRSSGTSSNPVVTVQEALAGGALTNASGSSFTVSNTNFHNVTITAGKNLDEIRILNTNTYNLDLDAISFTISCEEICGNGVDDDGDGLVDCADDDCNLGIATSVVSSTGVSNANNSLGAADSQFAQLYDSSDEITLKLSQQINAGDNYTIRWRRSSGTSSNPVVTVQEALAGGALTNASGSSFTVSNTNFHNVTIAAGKNLDEIRILNTNTYNLDLDAISFTISCEEICGNGLDDDADGDVDCNDSDCDCCDLDPGILTEPVVTCPENDPSTITSLETPSQCNLVDNPHFEDDLNGWFINNSNGADATISLDNTGQLSGKNSLFVEQIVATGTSWHTELNHEPIKVFDGVSYMISFDAKALAARSISVELQLREAPWTTFDYQTVNLTTSASSYSITLTPGVDSDNFGLMFKTGGSSVDFWIDNIAMKASSCTEPSYVYQWQYSDDNGASWNTVSFQISESYDPPAITTNRIYRRRARVSGCSNWETSDEMLVETCPCSIDAGMDQTICNGDSVILNTEAQGSVTYSWSPATGLDNPSAANPVASPTTTTTYTVTVDDGAGCTVTDQVIVTVDPLPEVLCYFNVGAGWEQVCEKTVCAGTPVTFSAHPAINSGVTWTWTGPDGFSADTRDAVLTSSATVAQTGVYTVTYIDANGCADSADLTLTVNALPIVDLSLGSDEACADEASVILTGGTPSPGTYSGLYVSGTTFDVASAGVGTHSVTYTYTDANGCTSSDTQDFTVYALPTVELTLDINEACDDVSTIVLGGGTPINGNYSGPNVSGNTFDVAAAGIGAHTVTYTYMNGSGCEDFATDIINVYETVTPTFTLGTINFCSDETTYNLTEGSPANGVYSGAGVTGDNFDASAAGIGPHTITYTFATSDGCEDIATADLEVYALPTVTFTPSISEVCESDPTYTFDGFSPSGGTFSGPGVSGNQLDPSALTVYSNTIVYTYTDANGCSASASAVIILNKEPVITTITPVQPSCELDNGSITIEFEDVEFTTDIQFSLDGGASWETILADDSGTVTYSDLGPDNYDLSVRKSNGYCTLDLTDVTLTNQVSPSVDVGSDLAYCASETRAVTPIVTGGTLPIAYVWTGPNGFSESTLDITVADEGTYDLLVTDINNCTASDQLIVTYVDTTVIFCERYRIREDDIQWGPWINFTGGNCTIELCENEGLSDINFDGGPETSTGWVWSEEDGNVNNQSQDNIVVWSDMDQSDAGTYSGVYTNADGCISTLYFEVVVHANPVANAGADDQICLGFTTTLTASGGVSYLWDDPANTGNASVEVSPETTTTYTVTVTDINGCSDTDEVIVTVEEPADVQLNEADVDFCQDAASFTLSGGTPSNGTYSGPGVSGGVFDPAIAGVGVHTISYSFDNGCVGTATQDMTVYALPTTTLNLTQVEACEDLPGFTLDGGSPSGGIYSGTGVEGNYFNIVVAGIGVHTITYTYSDDSTGCEDFAIQDVEIIALPSVSLTLTDDSDCVINSSLTLEGGSPENGTWSGPGVIGSNFDASTAGQGDHTITYTYTDISTGCTDTAQDVMTVEGPPNVFFSLSDYNVCADETAFVLDGENPVNGTWSGPGVTGSTFDATGITGSSPITYTYIDDNGCSGSQTQDIYVDALPEVTLALAETDFCFGDDNIALSGESPANGIWSGTAVSGNVFNTTTSGLGTHTITYTYTDSLGCSNSASQDVTVYDKPVVTLSLSDDEACVIEDVHVLDGGSPPNGEFSGSGVSGTNFDPSLAGVGTHTILYTFTDGNGCWNEAEDVITVYDIPVATLDLDEDEVCIYETLSLSGGSPSGGTWSGLGVTGNVFDPAIAGIGTHTITYEFNVSSCNSSSTDQVTVYDIPSVSLSLTENSSCFGPNVTLSGGTPSGGVWSGSGVFGGNQLNTTIAGSGTHTITYTYEDANGCEAEASQDFTIHALPEVLLNLPITEDCVDNTVLELSGGTPVNGVFSGPGVTGTNFNASVAGTGDQAITYTFIDGNGCENFATQNIRVSNVPDVNLSLTDDEACTGDDPDALRGGWPLGGTWSGPGVVGNTIDPSLAGIGVHTISYTIIRNGCSSTATDTYEVHAGPIMNFVLVEDEYCIGETGIVMGGGSPVGGVYSGNGVNSLTGRFSTVAAGIGTHTITYRYQDSEGCTGFATDELTVRDVPSARLTLTEDRACATDDNIILNGGTPAGGTWSGPAGSVTGNIFDAMSLGAGLYTISYTYVDPSTGCEAVATDRIRVDPAPNVSFTYEDDHCNKNDGEITFNFINQSNIQYIEFSINGGLTWREVTDGSGSTTFSNLSAGSYDLLVRNRVGTCEASLGTANIQNIPAPTADAGIDVSINAPSSTQLNGSGADFYSWTPSTGLNNTNIPNPIASPSVTTTYTLEVTDLFGCKDTDEVTVTVVPPCAGTISAGDYPYTESFESGIGLWSQETILDDFDWTRDASGTPSSSTGPSSGSHGSWYMFTEASGQANYTTIFKSPCFDLDNQSCAQFTFDYHMYGNTTGSLSLEASINFGTSWSTIWTQNGQTGNNWLTEVVDLFSYINNNTQLRFVATIGNGSKSDIAIDNVEFITTGCGCDDTSSPYVDFSLVPDPQPNSVDIDGDGDADMLAGGDGELFFFENNGDGTYTDRTGTALDIMPQLSFLDMTLGFCDLDGDGDFDMSVVGNESSNKYFYWNTGTATNPIFTQATSGNNPISGFDFNALDGGAVIGYADPTIFWMDLDDDGDNDAVVGGKLGWFHYYENTGSASSPNLVRRVGSLNPLDGFRADGEDENNPSQSCPGSSVCQYESSPYLIDWDGDGDFDMFSGNQVSTVQYFENIGTAFNPEFVERRNLDNPFDNVIFSEDSHIAIIDEDCDGDWDVFYGVGDTPDDAEITLCDLLVSVPNFASPGSNQTHFCEGETAFLLEESKVGIAWNWTGPNGFYSTDRNPVITSITSMAAGTYNVTVTNEQGCEFESSVDITVSFATCDAGPEFTVDLGESVQLEGSGTGVTYKWSPSAGLSNSNVLNPIVTPTSTTTYTLTVTDEFGCISSCETTIYVRSDICEYGEKLFEADFETTTGDNYWTIGSGASDGNFIIGVPSPYTSTNTTIMELAAHGGDQTLVTGIVNNQDLDGGPTSATSRSIVLPTNASSLIMELYYYFAHITNANNNDYLNIQVRDASNSNVLENVVSEVGDPSYRNASWTAVSIDLSAHAGKTIYLYVEASDPATPGSKLDMAIDDITIEGMFSTMAVLELPETSACETDDPITLTGGSPSGGTYSGPGVSGGIFDPEAALVTGPGPYIISYEYNNSEGCLATATDEIDVLELPETEINLAVGEACETELNVGLFGGTPTGGTYSGLGVSGSSFSPASVGPGTYPITYTVTDANGCMNSAMADFIVYSAPVVTEVTDTNATCGQDNGSLTISFDDVVGIDSIQFSMDAGNTWETPVADTDGAVAYTNLSIGTYDLWVRKNNGDCAIDIENAIIIDEPGPQVDAGLDHDLCSGVDKEITPIVQDGIAPYEYAWSGPDDFTATTLIINVSEAGTYVITVTDDNDCTSTDEVIITTSDLLLEAELIDETCFGAENGRILATATTGSSPYTYSIPGEGSNTTGVFNNLSAGHYVMTVVDNLGCELERDLTVSGPPELMCSPELCTRTSSMEWTGTQEGPWNSDNGTRVTLSVLHDDNTGIDNSDIGEFLTTTDPLWFVESAAGLPALRFQFEWDDTPESALTDIDTLGDDKGTAIFTLTFDHPMKDVVLHIDRLGEAGGYPGNYISNSSEWTVTTPGVILQKLSGTSDLQVSAMQFYRTPDVASLLEPEATENTADGTAAGSIAILSQTPLTSVTFEVTGIGIEGAGFDAVELALGGTICEEATLKAYGCDGSPGSASISACGGQAPYAYLWDNNETTQTAINLSAGTHDVTITDANSCEVICSVEIPESELEVNAGPNLSFCIGADGMLSPNAMSGLAPYDYAWTGPGGFTSDLETPTVIEGGTYILIVTDANGCSGSDMAEVYSFECNQTSLCHYLHEFNTLSYFGSDGSESWSNYSWDESGDNNSAASGDVMIFGGALLMENRDDSPPSIRRRVDLTGHSSAILSFDFWGEGALGVDDEFMVEVFDGSIWTTVFTYSGAISGTQMPWLDISAYIAASTEIRFTIVSGFEDSGERLFIDNVRIDLDCLCDGIADAGVDVMICEGDSTQLIGSGGVTYEWTPTTDLSDSDISNPIAYPITTTTYTLTVTDENGCTDTAEVTVLVNENVIAAAVETSQDLCMDSTGEATVTVSQGNGPYTITWQTTTGTEQGTTSLNSDGSYTITGLNGGTTYCIQVTDVNGCTVQTP